MSLNKKCLDRMDTITSSWFIGETTKDPMLLKMWCKMEKLADPKQESVGIDTRSFVPVFRYNPNFINALTTEQLETILAMECLKLLLNHPTLRVQNPRHISGLSSQITIGELIKDELKKIVGINETMPHAKDFQLPEESYKEHYFKLLLEKSDDVENTLSKMYGKKEDPEENDEQGNGSGDSENDPEENDEQGKDFKNSQEALKNYFDPRNTNSKNWTTNENLAGEIGDIVREMKSNASSWGKYTGDIVDKILAAHTPKITVREVLRRFQTSITTHKTYMTRMKPNRRFDLEYMGRRYENMTKILLAGDSSGSMSDEDISEFFAVVNSVCKHSKLDFMLWDTEIKLVEKNFKKARKQFVVNGRGGTNPQMVLDYAEKGNYDGVVIFSDMYFQDDLRQPKGTKVLWLGTHKSSPNTIPWGFHAKLDR